MSLSNSPSRIVRMNKRENPFRNSPSCVFMQVRNRCLSVYYQPVSQYLRALRVAYLQYKHASCKVIGS